MGNTVSPRPAGFVAAVRSSSYLVGSLRTERGPIDDKTVAQLIAKSGFTPDTLPRAMRQDFADFLCANLERFTPRAQRALDLFINPVYGTGQDIYDGLQPGSGPGAEPAIMADHAGKVSYAFSYGRIASSDPVADDLRQGADGDCWFDASAAAFAHAGLLKAQSDGGVTLAGKPFITPRADGQIEVTFHVWNKDGTFTPRTVAIDRSLPELGNGTVYDGEASADRLWAADLEKAFALLRGGYDAINGGFEYDALATLSGRKPTIYATAKITPNELFSRISAAVAARQPITADTYPAGAHDSFFAATGVPDDGFNETGVVNSHAYTILGTTTHPVVDQNGFTQTARYVVLRNPWGTHQPTQNVAPSNGRNDGTFELPLDLFIGCYQFVHTVAPLNAPDSNALATPAAAESYIDANSAQSVRTMKTPSFYVDSQGRTSPVEVRGSARLVLPMPKSVSGVRAL